MSQLGRTREGTLLQVSGKRIPFTLWPDNYHRHGGPLRASDCWQCLSAFVSAEKNVKEKIRGRTKAYIEQSRDFYLASREAQIGTKPLMLYYSYLNLAKAFLMFRKNALSGKYDHHGLTNNDTPDKYTDLASIPFQVSKLRGDQFQVFGELVKECKFPALAGRSFNLKEMMSQVVGLRNAFTAHTTSSQVFFPVKLDFVNDRKKKKTWIIGEITLPSKSQSQAVWKSLASRRLGRIHVPNKAGGKIVLGESDSVSSEEGTIISFQTQWQASYKNSPIYVLREKLISPMRQYIWSEQTSKGFKYYYCTGTDYTAQVASNFAIMYTLGMIVRYRPELIENLESEWLIHEYLNTQPLQFVYLLGSGFVRNEIIPSSLPE